MKRIIILICFIIASLNAFAQLNITSSGSKSERFYKDQYLTVSWTGKEFLLNASDPVTALSIPVTLGITKTQAIMSIVQILDWVESSENQSYITIENNGEDILLYKRSGYICISNGDPDYVRKEMNRRLTSALAGGGAYRKKEATPVLSFITQKALRKIHEALEALNDPKYLGQVEEGYE